MVAKKKILKAKAKINLKYDDEIVKIGKEFEVKVDDYSDMVEKGYISLLEDLPKEDEVQGEEVSKDGK